jgi:hypothetical protein
MVKVASLPLAVMKVMHFIDLTPGLCAWIENIVNW